MAGLLFGPRRAALGVSGLTAYERKSLGYDPIAYWPLKEKSGGIAFDISGNGFNGLYIDVLLSQAGIGDGNTAPYFDGISAYANVFSAGLASAFPGDEGTITIWAKLLNIGLWSGGTAHNTMRLAADGVNSIGGPKQVSDEMSMQLTSGATFRQRKEDCSGFADIWHHFAATWSESNDRLRYYHNGSLDVAEVAGLGAWVGNLDSANCTIGKQWVDGGAYWNGWLAHVMVFDNELSGTSVTDLAIV